ncbi:MAG: hypothetical protein AMS21_03145 [Gemmatimonas sp. SG8_38_2]|nr:MAG: hypothetical protein AMS21_03145 [Gemmatimonas sp. SG8_38_2]
MPETRGEVPASGERRKNHELRERLDEIVLLARKLSQDGPAMSREELDATRMRIEWLSEEIWAAAAYGPLEERLQQEAPEPGEYSTEE